MEFLNVLVAAIASFAAGAVWYMRLADPWMEAAGVQKGPDGKPANSADPRPYIVGFLATLLVAGMMRHVFALGGIDTLGEGLVSGFGIGLFLAAPWLVTNYSFAGRPIRLMLIDGGYSTLGCTVIGFVLTLF
ncbi:MAG: DUF1761 domain-containing protein [Pseudomonadota bacterium]